MLHPGPDAGLGVDPHQRVGFIGATGRPVFWRRDRPQILALVDRFLDDDAARRRADGTRPLAAEHAFGLHEDDAVRAVVRSA